MITINNQSVLSELQKLVDTKKLELQEAEQALRVVERLLGKPSLSSNIKAAAANTINLDQIYFEANDTKKTLRSEVEDVIKRIGAQEFSVAHIEAALKQSGITVNGKHPRARISMVLNKVEEGGQIRKTYTGKGNIPHRYKAVATELFGVTAG